MGKGRGDTGPILNGISVYTTVKCTRMMKSSRGDKTSCPDMMPTRKRFKPRHFCFGIYRVGEMVVITRVQDPG